MKNTIFRERRISELKREMVKKYVYIMIFVLAIFTIIFWSGIYLNSTFLTFYTLSGIIVLSLGWYFLKDRIDLTKIVRGYLIIAPLYAAITMLIFWNYSATSYVWLTPIPVGAYIFFSLKEVIIYSTYALIIIIIVAILGNYFEFLTIISTSHNKVRLADIFIFTSNLIIITHLLTYRNKIRDLETIAKIEKYEKIELPISLDKEEIQQYNNIFKEIEKVMIEKQAFKDPNFNISTLCTSLKYSNSYISRAIRYQNYSNFNSYLNFHRIEYVINLIQNTDLEKLTIFYIYTEAGYNSQSTFNRAFKELKGITPSEYIRKIKKS